MGRFLRTGKERESETGDRGLGRFGEIGGQTWQSNVLDQSLVFYKNQEN